MNETPDRLDMALVARGLAPSRSRARDAVLRGTVRVDGKVEKRPSAPVSAANMLVVDDPAAGLVSRAALKLMAGLDHFGLDPSGLSGLDVGQSTGGFTQVLLARGAAHVTGIEVGHGQLAEILRDKPKMTALEGLNARELAASHLAGRPVEFIVSDVSFISLKLALPPALALAEPGAFALLLVKPQFEAGREAIGKNGLLKNPETAPLIADDLALWLATQAGWSALGIIPSPIAGGDGNQEFLLAGRKAP